MIRIQTGRRLHFGLLSPLPVPELDLAFGGLGMMVDAPGVVVQCRKHDRWAISGPMQNRAEEIISKLLQFSPSIPPLQLTIEQIAPEHQGWGTGTQLTMALAQLCIHFSDMVLPINDLVRGLGRGQRSNIGIEGFQHGGFLHDLGYSIRHNEPRSVIAIPLPTDWTFVLVEPGQDQGLYSLQEKQAFKELKNVAVSTVTRLQTMATDVLLPAAASSDFSVFARHLTEYNRLSGTFYHSVQFGDYSFKQSTERLLLMERCGALGRGQSSWGPGLFALFSTKQEAEAFCQECILPGCSMLLAPAFNSGAMVQTIND